MLLDPDVLAKLVALTIERGAALDPAMASGVPSSGARLRVIEPLTQSERRVIRAMVETGDVAAAAAALHLSAHTVRYHLKRTYRKLGADNRADALRIAQEVGLID